MATGNRTNDVVSDIVRGVREALLKHNVTFDEYRAAVAFLLDCAAKKEVPLLVDLFFNTTIVEIEGKMFGGSRPSLEGPYYLENAPVVTERLAIREQDKHQEPILLRGRVTTTGGRPLARAAIDIWHSTPEGKYSGIHDGIPPEFYRGKVFTDHDGRYSVRSILPVPYQIPNEGPTGALLDAMGRHSWRPAHVHYKVSAPGMHTHISQAYFEGGDYVGDDCCEDVCDEHIVPEKFEDGVRIVELDFVVPRAEKAEAA